MEQIEKVLQARGEKFEAQYGDLISMAADSLAEKFEYEWTPQDSAAMGKALQNWEEAKEILESDATTVSMLGPALSSNLGLVAMQYASLPIQYLASVQPIEDTSGTVFYRTALAGSTRGGVNKGDQLLGAYGQVNGNVNNYMSDTQTKTDLTVVDDGGKPKNGAYAFNLGSNLVTGSVKVRIGDVINAIDDGNGHLIGVGIDADSSKINYKTGDVSVTFVGLATRGVTIGTQIPVVYSTDLLVDSNVPSMTWTTVSKSVDTRYYVLQSTYNTLTDFQVKKKFGKNFSTEITSDLVQQSNTAVLIDTILNLKKAAQTNRVNTGRSIVWADAAPSAVSTHEYRRNFEDKIIESVDEMVDMIGKGDASFYIVNTKGKQIFKSLGMTTVRSGVTGVHMIGMFDGAPVYYAPTNIIAKNEILVGYRGTQWFESAAVHAPYMPITTETGSARDNVFTKHEGVASASGNECLVNEFVQLITIN